MLKYIALVLGLGLLGCSGDPLEVETISSDETAPSDGLQELNLTSDGEHWTEADGILTANAPASLELLPAHGAVTLGMSYRVTEGASARLLLGGKYPLSLPDLGLDRAAAPRTVVSVSPGVWQNLEIAFLPAEGQDPPLLVGAYLNGNLVYYQQPLTETGGDAGGPLTLEVESGSISVTNVRSIDRAGRSSTLTDNGEVDLNLPLIRYAYYPIEGNPKDFTAYGSATPAKEGYISRFDIDGIREQNSSYAIRFTSDLDIPSAGSYSFHLRSPSPDRLYIDDQLVVDLSKPHEGLDQQGAIELGEGNHQVRLDHFQNGGWNFLKVKYTFEDQEEKSFNDIPEDRAVSVPSSGEVVEVKPDDRPYLLRSFLNFPPGHVYDFTDKRTHVISVGEKDGPHYSYDLRNGSILQVWRGPFIDASQMWVERGEPQVARAIGPVIAFDGRPQYSTEGGARWPEGESDFRHLRHELDATGRPTFFFATPDGGELSDEIVPTQRGLQRTISNLEGDASLYTTVVAASNIRETAPGTFELVNPGLNLHIDDLAAGGLKLLQGNGSQRLVAEIPAGEHLTYSIDW